MQRIDITPRMSTPFAPLPSAAIVEIAWNVQRIREHGGIQKGGPDRLQELRSHKVLFHFLPAVEGIQDDAHDSVIRTFVVASHQFIRNTHSGGNGAEVGTNKINRAGVSCIAAVQLDLFIKPQLQEVSFLDIYQRATIFSLDGPIGERIVFVGISVDRAVEFGFVLLAS